jgi:hypothetical protein
VVRRRAITADDLAGQAGLRRSARDAILARQPETVAEALEIADVGRKTTMLLLKAGLLIDPEGRQAPRREIRASESPFEGGRALGIEGKWRITGMDLWDQEAIDLLGPAFVELKGQGAASGSSRSKGE